MPFGHKPKLDSKMPNAFEITLLEDDRLLLLTDGFFDVVPDEDLLRLTLDTESGAIANRLTSIAKERGTTDNVSAIVATVIPRPNLAARRRPRLWAAGPVRRSCRWQPRSCCSFSCSR